MSCSRRSPRTSPICACPSSRARVGARRAGPMGCEISGLDGPFGASLHIQNLITIKKLDIQCAIFLARCQGPLKAPDAPLKGATDRQRHHRAWQTGNGSASTAGIGVPPGTPRPRNMVSADGARRSWCRCRRDRPNAIPVPARMTGAVNGSAGSRPMTSGRPPHDSLAHFGARLARIRCRVRRCMLRRRAVSETLRPHNS